MANIKKYKAEYIASELRKYFEEASLLASNTRAIDEQTINIMITSFKGSLEPAKNNQKTYIRKTGKDQFIIYYADRSDYLSILHEFGHAFLDLAGMEIEAEAGSDGLDESDDAAWLFARTLAMPREEFETAVIEHKCNVQAIADTYNLDWSTILLRGMELNIWE